MRLIDADAFERRCMFDSNIEDMQDVIYALRDYSTVPAIPIPENATNGDMIKALFPNLGINSPLKCNDTNWWNAPYKRGDTE